MDHRNSLSCNIHFAINFVYAGFLWAEVKMFPSSFLVLYYGAVFFYFSLPFAMFLLYPRPVVFCDSSSQRMTVIISLILCYVKNKISTVDIFLGKI